MSFEMKFKGANRWWLPDTEWDEIPKWDEIPSVSVTVEHFNNVRTCYKLSTL